MNPRVSDIVTEMSRQRNQMGVSVQLGLMGELQALLAEEAEKQSERLGKQMTDLVGIAAAQKALADKLDRQTHRLICLSYVLAFLTFLLLLFTVYLSYDVYLQSKGTEPAKPHASHKAYADGV